MNPVFFVIVMVALSEPFAIVSVTLDAATGDPDALSEGMPHPLVKDTIAPAGLSVNPDGRAYVFMFSPGRYSRLASAVLPSLKRQ